MECDELLQAAIDIGVGKQNDYGACNTHFQAVSDMLCDAFGVVITPAACAQVLCAVKLVRFKNLTSGANQIQNESITDTVIDLVRYLAMMEATRNAD